MEKEEKIETKKRFDLIFWVLIIALIALPLAATFLHIKLHPDYKWLIYITLFDTIIITLMYFSRKTIFYGFMLNTVFFIVGVIAHFYVLKMGAINDVLMSIPDFSVGYVLWRLYR